MSQTPNPVNRKNLGRASLIGFALGAFAIVLFVVFWLMLDSLGLSRVPRLLVAICLPPAILAGLIGLYILVIQPRRTR